MSTTVQPTLSERARKNYTSIIRGLDEVGLNQAAKCLNVSQGTVSKMKNPDQTEIKITFHGLACALADMGLKVVPENMKCYNPETIESILHLAKERMDQIHTPEQLLWEDSDEQV
jgi:hypothetical protein